MAGVPLAHLTTLLQRCHTVSSVTDYFPMSVSVSVAQVTRLNQRILTTLFTTLKVRSILCLSKFT